MPSSSDRDRPEADRPEKASQARTGKLPSPPPTGPLLSLQTSARLPIVIPAEQKRRQATPPETPRVRVRRPRKRLAWIIVLLSGCVSIVLVFIFAVPLSTSQQQSFTLARGISNFITTGQFGGVNTAQHDSPTTINTNCGGTDIWGTCAHPLLDNGTLGTGQFQRPIQGAVISQVFANPEYQVWCGCVKPHSGIDLAAPYGTPITASDSGEVIWVGWDWSGLGWAVKISHGNYLATIYGHLARYVVQVGQYVTEGQLIAYEGSTGASTGPHVHFMLLVHNVWVNPASYMQLP